LPAADKRTSPKREAMPSRGISWASVSVAEFRLSKRPSVRPGYTYSGRINGPRMASGFHASTPPNDRDRQHGLTLGRVQDPPNDDA